MDMLARMGTDQDLNFVFFDSPPEDIRSVLDEDCNGRFFNRLCTELDVIS